MASIITATTTSGLTQSADNSGVLQLASGTGNLVTIPSVTGTAMVSGNMPAFYAHGSAGNDQVISNNTATKVILNAELFDTSGTFNTSTYRFTPNVAGYYQISGLVEAYANGSNITNSEVYLYKNGSFYCRGTNVLSATPETFIAISTLVYLNGTTDYIELFARVGSSNTITLYGSPEYRFLTGVLVRTA